MISTELEAAIEAHASRIRATNPLVTRAASGDLSPVEVFRYLASVGYMTLHTIPHLNRAESVARSRDLFTLAEFFRGKRDGERGHEEWTHHDISVMQRVAAMDPEVVPAMRELATAVEHAIDEDPHLYLPFILWAEYITVLVGGELVEDLTSKCGIPGDALTALTNHVALDVEHVKEGSDELDEILSDPAMLPALQMALATFTQLFDRACVQMVEPGV